VAISWSESWLELRLVMAAMWSRAIVQRLSPSTTRCERAGWPSPGGVGWGAGAGACPPLEGGPVVLGGVGVVVVDLGPVVVVVGRPAGRGM
jgi:hypothetical protein